MTGRVQGKVIIVTGGASNPGLGYASAHNPLQHDIPGVIWMNMQAAAVGSDGLDSRIPASRVPLARAESPEDIAANVVYLASDEASYVTGAEFTIDAGMTAQ